MLDPARLGVWGGNIKEPTSGKVKLRKRVYLKNELKTVSVAYSEPLGNLNNKKQLTQRQTQMKTSHTGRNTFQGYSGKTPMLNQSQASRAQRHGVRDNLHIQSNNIVSHE